MWFEDFELPAGEVLELEGLVELPEAPVEAANVDSGRARDLDISLSSQCSGEGKGSTRCCRSLHCVECAIQLYEHDGLFVVPDSTT